MKTTQLVTRVPDEVIDRARETFTEAKDLSPSRILRYALAVALGMSDPLSFTEDLRKGQPRKPRKLTD